MPPHHSHTLAIMVCCGVLATISSKHSPHRRRKHTRAEGTQMGMHMHTCTLGATARTHHSAPPHHHPTRLNLAILSGVDPSPANLVAAGLFATNVGIRTIPHRMLFPHPPPSNAIPTLHASLLTTHHSPLTTLHSPTHHSASGTGKGEGRVRISFPGATGDVRDAMRVLAEWWISPTALKLRGMHAH